MHLDCDSNIELLPQTTRGANPQQHTTSDSEYIEIMYMMLGTECVHITLNATIDACRLYVSVVTKITSWKTASEPPRRILLWEHKELDDLESQSRVA